MAIIETNGHVRIDTAGGVMRIAMDRPDKKNALTRAMYRAMADAISAADADSSVRVILISGSDVCFTSGNDLGDFQKVQQTTGPRELNPFMAAISRAEKPVVAAVNGHAVGIGTTMLLHCDLVYAGTGSRFQLPFVNLGLCPELASSFLLPRLAGYHRAAELLLLGEPFGAQTAREIGLVNEICPDGELFAIAEGKAAELAARPPAAVQLAKALMKRPLAETVSETLIREVQCFGERLRSPEAAEAFQAFAERRKPDFSRF